MFIDFVSPLQCSGTSGDVLIVREEVGLALSPAWKSVCAIGFPKSVRYRERRRAERGYSVSHSALLHYDTGREKVWSVLPARPL